MLSSIRVLNCPKKIDYVLWLTYVKLCHVKYGVILAFLRYVVDSLGITCFTTQDIDQLGIHKVMEIALDKVNPG